MKHFGIFGGKRPATREGWHSGGIVVIGTVVWTSACKALGVEPVDGDKVVDYQIYKYIGALLQWIDQIQSHRRRWRLAPRGIASSACGSILKPQGA